MRLLTFDQWIHNQAKYNMDDNCQQCEGVGYVWKHPGEPDYEFNDFADDCVDDFDVCPDCNKTGSSHYKEYRLQIKKDKKLLQANNLTRGTQWLNENSSARSILINSRKW